MRWTRKAKSMRVEEPKVETPSEKKPKKLWGPFSEEIEKDKPRWTYLVPPIATLLGTLGTIGILAWTLHVNNKNNSEERKETQEKNRVERKENAIRRLETQFSEVQTRLSSTSEQTRAVAILQLADLAQTPLPAEALTSEEEKAEYKITDFSRAHHPFFLRAVRQYATTLQMEGDASVRAATKDAVFILVKFLQKYMPLPKSFSSSPKQSAAINTTLPKALPAPEYIEAFYEIKEEVRNKENNVEVKTTRVSYPAITEVDVVWAEMTNELADANRKEKDNFITAFANYFVHTHIRPSRTQKGLMSDYALAAATNFCEADEEGKKAMVSALETLRKTSLFETQQLLAIQQKKYAANPDKEQKTKLAELLDALKLAAQILVDTRDALATTLTGHTASGLTGGTLASPSDFPSETLATASSEMEKLTSSLMVEVTEETKDIALAALMRAKEKISALIRNWKRSPAVNLKECFFVGAELHGAHLEGADLSEAQLQGANLTNALLQGVDLSETHFEDADLSGARMQGANLSETYLAESNLSNAQLQAADINKVDFKGTDLSKTHLEGADLSDSSLQGADFSEAYLQGANLSKRELQKVYFVETHLEGADLSESYLQEAHLDGAKLQSVDLSDTHLERADFSGAKLQQADLNTSRLYGSDFSKAQFDSVTYLYNVFVQVNDSSSQDGYSKTDFSETNWRRENFVPREGTKRSLESDIRTAKVEAWLKAYFPAKK